ncbi:Dps family protein [Olsenella uli]|uniref:Dps family protein n=1 Tax=Olsenella uli TaxID=133926 RepID=UPI00241D9C22|nr:DNA starvation/stationary phase protection protein [Olsenella uli]
MKKELVQQVNSYVANLGVVYIKTHNLHWNVFGLQFKAVHEYLEALYDAYADNMDEVAELLAQNGETPAASYKEFLELATIEDIPAKAWAVKDAIQTALDDMDALKTQALGIRDACCDEDFAVSNAMEDQVAAYNKEIWFMKSMLRQA